MTNDFYCDEVLSGQTQVDRVSETANVLAYHHTRPYWPTHIVVIPKKNTSLPAHARSKRLRFAA